MSKKIEQTTIKKNIQENLLKFKNIEIIYATAKQYWGITTQGLKKRVGLDIFNLFLKTKCLISYKDSLRIKKGVKFNILANYIQVILKKKNIIINFLNKQDKKKKSISTNLKFSKLSLILTAKLTKNLKKSYGIFFTSEILVNIIFNQLKIIFTKLRLKIVDVLEPSCGSGEFLVGLNKYFSKLNILGIEYNDDIYDSIKDFSLTNNFLTIQKNDFLKFFNEKGFDLIIGNPPFKIIKKSLVVNYSNFFLNGVNLYVLFLLHSLKQLRDNGVLVFVLPKNFLNCMSYNCVRLYIKNNYKILFIIDNLVDNFFLGTSIETCVLFLQKKKSNSKKYFVFFGEYLTFSNHYKYLNGLLAKGKPLKDFGFTISVGSVLKSNKNIFTGSKGYFICDNNIKNNQLSLNSTSVIYSDNLQYGNCIVIFRGYGNAKFYFKYALVDIQEGYLVESHLLIIKQAHGGVKLVELLEKFKNKLLLNFISLYFFNQSLNMKELELFPIF